jgi:hypothetical protein
MRPDDSLRSRWALSNTSAIGRSVASDIAIRSTLTRDTDSKSKWRTIRVMMNGRHL